jgi:hypothetical protein
MVLGREDPGIDDAVKLIAIELNMKSAVADHDDALTRSEDALERCVA